MLFRSVSNSFVTPWTIARQAPLSMGFPKQEYWSGLLFPSPGDEPSCQYRRCGVDPWVRKILWKRKQQPTSVFLLGKSHGQRILVGYSPWGCKRVRQDLAPKLEKSVAPHSSILTWKIPWAEEPGRLQPTGSHRVGQN